MKATLVLLPLLGITYMLFFVNPGEDEVSRVVFIYFNSFLESFQVQRPPRAPASPAPRPHTARGTWAFSRAEACGGRRLGRGGGGLEVGAAPAQALDAPPRPTPGFLRVRVLLLPQQRGKDPGLALGMAVGPLGPDVVCGIVLRSTRRPVPWEPQEGPCPRCSRALAGCWHGGGGASASSSGL